MILPTGQILQLDIPSGETLTVANEGSTTVYYGGPTVSSASNIGSIAAAGNAAVTGPAWIVSASGAGQAVVEYPPAIIPAVTQTSAAVVTTATTTTTPYGFSGQPQAAAISTTINAIVVDLAAIINALNELLAK